MRALLAGFLLALASPALADTPTLLNGWVVFDVNYYAPPSYFKDSGGVVHLAGVVKAGQVPGRIFILPAGYRPQYAETFPVITGGVFGEVYVQADGSVWAMSGYSAGLSLSGITFVAP